MTFGEATNAGREAVLRNQASEGRSKWTKADYEFAALTAEALLAAHDIAAQTETIETAAKQ